MIAKYLAAIASVALLGAFPARAQEYPRKPITVVVPFAAGGPTDTVARLLGVSMGKSLKTQIIVENVGGAGGTIGAARVAKAPPDASWSPITCSTRRFSSSARSASSA
jgi:tripartite-type tricarboxylate transporter receptor subunit TctC